MSRNCTKEEYENAARYDNLAVKCDFCGKDYEVQKNSLRKYLHNYCSKACRAGTISVFTQVKCTNCDRLFDKRTNQIKKSINHFCTASCAAIYNNKHKKFGTRRSKLEVFLQEQLTILYPDLLIEYNKKEAIGSELDIYIPSLNLAFELNGIFHYEPIFGKDKLEKIENNDACKFKACIENKINLCIIDVSKYEYFKKETAIKYLNIITNIINT